MLQTNLCIIIWRILLPTGQLVLDIGGVLPVSTGLIRPASPFWPWRRRSPKLLTEVDQLPPPAWRTITLDVPNRKYRALRFCEHKVRLEERSFR